MHRTLEDTVPMARGITRGDVQWLANIRHAGRCRMRMGREVLRLGAPRRLDPEEGRARIPQPQRALLRGPIRCRDYIEMPVL